MRLRYVAVTLLAALLGPVAAFSQDAVKIFPLSEVRAGLKGVGKTVFEGDKVEEFQVEIVGVLKNAIAPKHDVILARLSGGPLEKTGVIAGMSGSPVYVDGRLVGAVALAFPFSKEAYTGITPIEEMLSVVPAAETATPPAAQPHQAKLFRAEEDGASARLIPDERISSGDWGHLLGSPEPAGQFDELRLPVRFGGFSPEAMQTAAGVFERLGLQPLAGATLASSGTPSDSISAADVARIQPGSMVSMFLIRGDLNVNADCTVTYREGNNLYACGHRFLMTGPTQYPFAQSSVLATVPNLISSFKLGAPGPLVGSIHQDRFGAIYGVLGDKAPTIPVHIGVASSLNKRTEYNFDLVQESFLSPFLLNLGVLSTLTSTERQIGPATLEMKGKVRLSTGDSVDLEDVLSSDINTVGMAGAAAATPLVYLLGAGFPDLRIESVDLDITSSNEKRVAVVDQVWSTKSEVRPGERIEVTVGLRTPSGETLIQKIPVEIPASVSDKQLSLVVGSGPTLNALQNRMTPLGSSPRDLRQLVRALNRMRRNNRVYALLMAPQRSFIMQGDEYPSPPPSLIQTFLSDPANSANVVLSGTSVVGDFETKPSPYSIQGQRTIFLRVLETGP